MTINTINTIGTLSYYVLQPKPAQVATPHAQLRDTESSIGTRCEQVDPEVEETVINFTPLRR